MRYAQYTIHPGLLQFGEGADGSMAGNPHNYVNAGLSHILMALENGDLQGAIIAIRNLMTNPLEGQYPTTPLDWNNVIRFTDVSEDIQSNLQPLRIYTLGRFSVLKDGCRIQFQGKAQKKPIDLLKSIIALGGRDVAKQHIAELLWPDSEGDAAVSVINTTLSRLRKLIGKDALITDNGRITLDPSYCWVDCWELEKVLNTIKEHDRTTKDASVEVKKALGFYQGSFMTGEDEGWLISRRERIRSRFLYTLSQHGQALMDAGECEDAIVLYGKVLEIDNLNEECYLNLMRCLHSRGHQAEVIRVYQRCRQALHDTLGVEPSKECTALYTAITNGK